MNAILILDEYIAIIAFLPQTTHITRMGKRWSGVEWGDVSTPKIFGVGGWSVRDLPVLKWVGVRSWEMCWTNKWLQSAGI